MLEPKSIDAVDSFDNENIFKVGFKNSDLWAEITLDLENKPIRNGELFRVTFEGDLQPLRLLETEETSSIASFVREKLNVGS